MKSKSILKSLIIFTVVLSIPFLAGWGWNKPVTNPEVAVNGVGGRIYVVDVNNRMEKVRKIRGFDVSLSPDGTKIAYNRHVRISDDEHIHGLWTCNINGSGEKLISKKSGEGAIPRAIAWSPNGKRIAFEAHSDKGGGIYLVESSGKNEKFVLSKKHDRLSGWVDNKTLVFYREGDTYIFDIKTLKIKKKIDAPYGYYDEHSLSYPEDKLIYMQNAGKIEGEYSIRNIYISDIYGKNKKVLAKEKVNEKPKSRIFSFKNLKWGRSGKKIFYNAQPMVFESGQYMYDRRLHFLFRSSYYFLMCIGINDNNEIVKKTALRKFKYIY